MWSAPAFLCKSCPSGSLTPGRSAMRPQYHVHMNKGRSAYSMSCQRTPPDAPISGYRLYQQSDPAYDEACLPHIRSLLHDTTLCRLQIHAVVYSWSFQPSRRFPKAYRYLPDGNLSQKLPYSHTHPYTFLLSDDTVPMRFLLLLHLSMRHNRTTRHRSQTPDYKYASWYPPAPPCM